MKGRALWARVMIGILGLMLGHATSWFLFRQEILIDCDSGRLRQVLSIGPVTLRDKVLISTEFQAFPLPDGRQGLTGRERWSTVDVSYGFADFGGKRAICVYREGAKVFRLLNVLVKHMTRMSHDDAARLKEEALRALQDGHLVEFVRTYDGEQAAKWLRENAMDSPEIREEDS